MKFISICLVFVSLQGLVKGGGGPSDQPIGTTPPNFVGGEIANDAPPGPFFADFQPPFPTDAWWSGFTVGNQNADVAGPFPYQCQTINEGLMFGISDSREFDGTSVKVPTQHDWLASFGELPEVLANRKATSWDTQTVCLQYAGSGGATMDTCLVPGSPYMTLKYANAAIKLTSSNGDITDFHWVTPGQKASVTSPGGTYLIYVTEGTAELTVDATNKIISSSAGTTATLRFAKLKGASQEGILDAHKGTYATGVDFRYTVAGNVATVTWTWETEGPVGDLLLLSWPHHRTFLEAPNYQSIEYMTLKGPMKGILGNVWTFKYDLPTINWFAETPVNPSCMGELVKTLESDVDKLSVMVPGDFYFWGGAFARAAQLATIAEQVGRQDLVEKVVDILKESVEPWFDPAHVPAAAFETGWGGFINKEGWNNTWVDFGNAYYNDHHFHYGYLLHGGAVIGKYDAAWLAQHLDFFTHVARNVGNPSPNDPHYTVTRHMDFFAGHSWASGIANGAGPRDQESTGEAINGYYGLLLFAHVSNNQPLIDWARLLLAIEISGAKAYWHLYPQLTDEETPYPEADFRQLVTVGNVMDTQAGAWLFWGADKTQIAAIQILPLTPIGMETYDIPWMSEVLPYCKEEIDDPKFDDGFKCVIIAAYAKVNPQEAYLMSQELSDWGSGNSATNQLYFISTQESASDICSASAQTPEGLFVIQDVASGKFVVVDGFGHLVATTGADVLATKFTLGFTPGGGTIQSTVNDMFVTASPNGDTPITASRETAGSYEVFRFIQDGDDYKITAMVNRAQVSTSPETGELINNSNSTNGILPSEYRLVETQEPEPIEIPAQATIQSLSNNRYVVASAADPTLRTSGPIGTRFRFTKVPDSPSAMPYYTIQSDETNQYVTGNAEGSVPLTATAPQPQAWEHFQIVPYQGSYIFIHVASGMPVAVQPDDTLQDNTNDVNETTLWKLA